MVYNKFYNLGMKNVKICLISDIHFDKDYNLNIFEEIIKNIKENKPNFICISGDILDHADVIDYKDIINLKTFIVDLLLDFMLGDRFDNNYFIEDKSFLVTSTLLGVKTITNRKNNKIILYLFV